MGNLQSETSQFSSTYSLITSPQTDDERKIIKHRQTGAVYMLKEWAFMEKQQAEQMLTRMNEKAAYPDPSVLSPLEAHLDQYKGLCGNRFKVYAIIERPDLTLHQEFLYRKRSSLSFTESQLWKLMYDVSSGLIHCQRRGEMVSNVGMGDIYIIQGKYKVNDPDFLQVKGDLSCKELIVRKLGAVLLELGLMYRPKALSSLYCGKLQAVYGTFLAGTISKMINNYITLQGIHKYAEESLSKETETFRFQRDKFNRTQNGYQSARTPHSAFSRKQSLIKLYVNENNYPRQLHSLEQTLARNHSTRKITTKLLQRYSPDYRSGQEPLLQINRNVKTHTYVTTAERSSPDDGRGPESKQHKFTFSNDNNNKNGTASRDFQQLREPQNIALKGHSFPKKIISLKKKPLAPLKQQPEILSKMQQERELARQNLLRKYIPRTTRDCSYGKSEAVISSQSFDQENIEELRRRIQEELQMIERNNVKERKGAQQDLQSQLYLPQLEVNGDSNRLNTLTLKTTPNRSHNRTIVEVEESDWLSEASGKRVRADFQQHPKRSPSLKPPLKNLSESLSSQEGYEYIIQQYDGGSRYEGYKKNGKKQGIGKLCYQDGGMYEGEWKDDQMNGFGKLYYQNGKLAYEGYWRYNQFDGKGRIINDEPIPLPINGYDYRDFSNIGQGWISYEGEFEGDLKTGQGILKLSNGQILQGIWKDNCVHGKGTFFTVKSEVVSGIWDNNVLIKRI